jgi:hypothetical protein
LAAINAKVNEEIRLRQEITKAERKYKRIKQRNKNFNVNLDDEESLALEELNEAKNNLETYKEERQETLTQKGNENKIQTLQTRILSEQSRLEGLKSPDREGGFLIAPATEDRVRNLEKSIYKKEQEVLRLGGELRTPTKFDLYQPPDQEQAPKANVTDQARRDTRFGPGTSMEDLLGGGRQRIRTLIDLPEGSAVERKSNNVFSVNGVDSIFVYDRENNQLKPESVDAFYTGLYNLRPNEIAAFKRALGYSAEDTNGILTDKFKDDFFDAAKAVSEYNYGYAQSGLKQPVDLAKYLATPQAYPEIGSMIKQQKSGGTGGGAAIDANRLAANVDTVRLLETELGVSLSKQQRDKIARDLATGRINATTLPSTIASAGKLSLDEGEAAGIKAELKQIAAANGVDLGEAWFDNTTRNILQGKTARETVSTEILKQAKMKYAAPSVVAGLDAGFSVRDQASQYINWIAQVRGVDPKTISLDDPIINRAFTNRNDEGMAVQMSLYDWQDWAKQNDPTYAYSSMAEESYVSTLRAIGQAFGKSI